MHIYLFKVRWLYDDKEVDSAGVVAAESYSDAVARIVPAYDDIVQIDVVYYDGGEIFWFDDIEEMTVTDFIESFFK